MQLEDKDSVKLLRTILKLPDLKEKLMKIIDFHKIIYLKEQMKIKLIKFQNKYKDKRHRHLNKIEIKLHLKTLPLELLPNDIKMPLKLSLTCYLSSIKQGLIETMPKINLNLMLRHIMMP